MGPLSSPPPTSTTATTTTTTTTAATTVMSTSIEFTPLATSDPSEATGNPEQLDDDEPISTRSTPRRKRKPTLSQQIERITDAAVSGLGPVLLVLASLLLSTTIFCYFTVFFPYHYTWQEGEGIFGNLAYILHLIWASYLVWGIVANYYFAVRTPPGGVLDGVKSSVSENKRRLSANRSQIQQTWC